jgi:hypothetical protein
MIENLTNPGADPVDGDRIKITHKSGTIEIKEYHAPVDPGPAPTVYKIITPTRYLALVKTASQMTNAEFAAYDSDQHADMVYTRAMLASISGMIDINNADNMALVMEGLGYMATHGHTGQIDPADFAGVVLANWPTE